MTDPAAIYTQLSEAFNRREWRQAREFAARLLQVAPRHAGVYYMAGIAELELQQLPAAVEYLRRASVLEPGRADFAVHFAKALAVSHRNREARTAADRALALGPADANTLDTLGVIYTQVGEYLSATKAFSGATALAPAQASYRYNLATSHVSTGQISAAEAEIEACLGLDPRYWRAHLTLAQLRRWTPEDNHVERLQALLAEVGDGSRDTAALICLNMALAKEYEDLGEYPAAFGHLVRGKAAGGAGRSYTITRDEALFTAIAESFPGPQAASTGCMSDEPIFIIGMPRSGTTLVERIISSHPDVRSAGELLNFGMSLKQASGSRTSTLIDADTIVRARGTDWKKLGDTYLASTRPTTGHSPRFIDKLPHNFLYAGFIANALPNAKIICLRRDPMDTCLSNFRQLFAPRSPYFDYSFDLLDTGRYFVQFDHLMAHWRKVLPGRILEVDYETLVESQEASSRRLLEFCGLPWHDDCLRFENNPSPVATASAVQVRAPIYRSSLKRWKKYGPQLDALHELLISSGITIQH
ncbi:sulfotransferase [Rhodanobacter sp. C01]|uniref:tetratricopeptide repeat-containing sulfotransferase family protein n=1 Tax=Rhodanobacter sp. C01 TaxID=1945856 RepID=UPI0009855F8E|nr:sulfotransferase [Rhodanobacter sp. C01]OOG48749.1 sulfotransferase [Rhodanobacter sp. C01]